MEPLQVVPNLVAARGQGQGRGPRGGGRGRAGRGGGQSGRGATGWTRLGRRGPDGPNLAGPLSQEIARLLSRLARLENGAISEPLK